MLHSIKLIILLFAFTIAMHKTGLHYFSERTGKKFPQLHLLHRSMLLIKNLFWDCMARGAIV
jgi:hypothetical protein